MPASTSTEVGQWHLVASPRKPAGTPKSCHKQFFRLTLGTHELHPAPISACRNPFLPTNTPFSPSRSRLFVVYYFFPQPCNSRKSTEQIVPDSRSEPNFDFSLRVSRIPSRSGERHLTYCLPPNCVNNTGSELASGAVVPPYKVHSGLIIQQNRAHQAIPESAVVAPHGHSQVPLD